MPPSAAWTAASTRRTALTKGHKRLDEGIESENASHPYSRMTICKPHWRLVKESSRSLHWKPASGASLSAVRIRFIKCVKRRDELVLRGVKRWERRRSFH